MSKDKKKVGLILVGDSGVGKTALLRSLQDMLCSVPFEDRQISSSFASNIFNAFKIDPIRIFNEEWEVDIIDTSGADSVEGRNQTILKIKEFLLSHRNTSIAICFLIKRGTNRLNLQFQSTISEIKALLPEELQNNFLICLTFSDIPLAGEDTLSVLRSMKLPEENIIAIDNKAYQKIEYDNSTIKGRLIQKQLKSAYQSNQENLILLLEETIKLPVYRDKTLNRFKIISDELEKEKVEVADFINRIIEQKQLFKKSFDELEENEKKIQANRNHTSQIQGQCKELVNYFAICHRCQRLNKISYSYFDFKISSGAFYFRNVKCSYCDWSGHFFSVDKEYKIVTKTTLKTNKEMKELYDCSMKTRRRLEEDLKVIENNILKYKEQESKHTSLIIQLEEEAKQLITNEDNLNQSMHQSIKHQDHYSSKGEVEDYIDLPISLYSSQKEMSHDQFPTNNENIVEQHQSLFPSGEIYQDPKRYVSGITEYSLSTEEFHQMHDKPVTKFSKQNHNQILKEIKLSIKKYNEKVVQKEKSKENLKKSQNKLPSISNSETYLLSKPKSREKKKRNQRRNFLCS